MNDYIEMNVNLKVKIKATSVQSLILQTLFNYWGDRFFANGKASFKMKEDGSFCPYVDLHLPERLPVELVKKISSLVFSNDDGKDENISIVDLKLGKMKWENNKVDCSKQSDVDL